jgi:hypothetical protein
MTMSLAELKVDAKRILESTTAALAPEALADHLLLKKNRSQLVAIAKVFLSTLGPKRKAPIPHARRRVGPHRKARERALVPTSEQKTGALAARAQVADLIFEHKLRGGKMLGEIRVHELKAIVEAAAHSATSLLWRGYEDAVDTFLCASLADHCVAADPFGLVKDMIKPSDAVKMLDRAKIRAAEALRDGSARLAKELITSAHIGQ